MQVLSSLIANYLETGQYEKQLSPDTIKAYRIDLQQFSNFRTAGSFCEDQKRGTQERAALYRR